ncbi:hypothetical protein COV24_04330 [candidate division WWE3 bacterium CG10_big_fil_rev_8_21_14_0_10_32_10]|uniref:Pyrrolo-quinoline quinone repeat domain-containing protein n=1 Tax=candidate division WWE3 bacterium CG10_big_fil_rev_8_21_14_0_10_32_10 TaxID=1975090 RepID=A0A2H0RAW2_UNCKA|nr:MAG: hypothetical protein COV24_04330 [candidate division WWE3 bacterium CG10_big_fil_rev_8_21_14_0_10_32_10]
MLSMSKTFINKLKIFTVFLLFLVIGIGLYLHSQRNSKEEAIEINQVQAQTTNCDDPALYPHNWSQVQNNPQHTGYTDEVLGTTIPTRTWVYRFQPDKIHTQIQPIIYCGKVFIGTEGAHGKKPRLFAFDAYGTYSGATTAPVQWTYEVGGPIVNSVAAADGKVFFGAGDGAVYAIPVDSSDGTPVWSYDAGSPILQTAAYDNGKVFFGTFDMHMYALNTSDGSLAWKTDQPLAGLSMKEYWPVVYDGKVIVRTESHLGDSAGGIKPGFPFAWHPTGFPWLSETIGSSTKGQLLAQE